MRENITRMQGEYLTQYLYIICVNLRSSASKKWSFNFD